MPMKRIVMHWTAGSNNVSALDQKHYHEIVDGDGNRVRGDKLPEANESTRDGHYAAHTRALNTGSIGVSMAAMAGAQERPFSKGSHPITKKQLEAFVEMVAEYAETYGIPITRRTVLTHAEVQPTLGVRQRGKWDITWIPSMRRPGDPVEVGDKLREMIINAQKNEEEANPLPEAVGPVTSSFGEDDAKELAALILQFMRERS